MSVNPKKHLCNNNPEAIDKLVHERVATFPEEGFRYRKCTPPKLFERLDIDFDHRSDVFMSLRRLEYRGYISREEVAAEKPGRGEPKQEGSLDVICKMLVSPQEAAERRSAERQGHVRDLVMAM